MNDPTSLGLYFTCDWEQNNLFYQCIKVLYLIKLLSDARLFCSNSFITDNWAKCSAVPMIIQVFLQLMGHCHVLKHGSEAELAVRWNTFVQLQLLPCDTPQSRQERRLTPNPKLAQGDMQKPHSMEKLPGWRSPCWGARELSMRS